MADHLRTQIRDAVVTAVTGLATTGANVFAARPGTRPVQTSELPALLVYSNDTDSEPSSGQRGSRRFEHVAELLVLGLAAGTGDVDRTLDTIEKEVRAALEGNPTLSGKCKDLWLERAEKEHDEEAEQPTWLVRMTWRCEYHTREGVPDAALA